MKIIIKNFFTSGHDFDEEQSELKSKYQMLNVGLLLSSIGLVYGIIANLIMDIKGIIPIELTLIFVNIILFFILRRFHYTFEIVSMILTAQFSFFFIFILYTYEPAQMKHIWLFTYPIVLLYLQNVRSGIYWLAFMLTMILALPFQTFVETRYTLFHVSYLSFVLLIVAVIIYFYKKRIDESRELIVLQQEKLKNFNIELEAKVSQKTSELQELNESLESKVKEKVEELIAKDKLITAQSKQAVMGEMISMIAHQWRQPLSTITLQISNLHIKKLLGNSMTEAQNDKVLNDISDTIVYLSDTIDDFQTYFRPNKEQEEIEVYELIQKSINFALPRIKENKIQIINRQSDIVVQTYINEMIQVILNLINNAVDSLIETNKDELKLELYAQNKDDSVLIFVQDNGSGISDDNISHIFEPYFSTKGKNGTGLGLYMSQMIVEKQFHGNIRVESSSKGTTFIVEISKQAS